MPVIIRKPREDDTIAKLLQGLQLGAQLGGMFQARQEAAALQEARDLDLQSIEQAELGRQARYEGAAQAMRPGMQAEVGPQVSEDQIAREPQMPAAPQDPDAFVGPPASAAQDQQQAWWRRPQEFARQQIQDAQQKNYEALIGRSREHAASASRLAKDRELIARMSPAAANAYLQDRQLEEEGRILSEGLTNSRLRIRRAVKMGDLSEDQAAPLYEALDPKVIGNAVQVGEMTALDAVGLVQGVESAINVAQAQAINDEAFSAKVGLADEYINTALTQGRARMERGDLPPELYEQMLELGSALRRVAASGGSLSEVRSGVQALEDMGVQRGTAAVAEDASWRSRENLARGFHERGRQRYDEAEGEWVTERSKNLAEAFAWADEALAMAPGSQGQFGASQGDSVTPFVSPLLTADAEPAPAPTLEAQIADSLFQSGENVHLESLQRADLNVLQEELLKKGVPSEAVSEFMKQVKSDREKAQKEAAVAGGLSEGEWDEYSSTDSSDKEAKDDPLRQKLDSLLAERDKEAAKLSRVRSGDRKSAIRRKIRSLDEEIAGLQAQLGEGKGGQFAGPDPSVPPPAPPAPRRQSLNLRQSPSL